MEDYILREIDKIGEMLLQIAIRLGLFKDRDPKCTLADVKSEIEKADLALDIDKILSKENPVSDLVEIEKVSDRSLEILVDILFHSDADETVRITVLDDAIRYLDHKGYYSFRLHSLSS